MCKRLKIFIGILIGLIVNSYSLQSQLPPIHFQTMLRNVQWTGDSLICRVKLFPNENAVQPEYLEEHHLPWNDDQYLSILIGSGIPALGNWNELAWDNPSKKVEIDVWQDGQWVNWVSQTLPFVPKAQIVLRGWQGPVGEVGPIGAQGSMGEQGLTGTQGVQGSTGLKGIEVDSISSLGGGNFIQWLSDGTTREWSFPSWPLGCTEATACNYASSALINDGSCLYAQSACDDGDAQTISDALDAFCQCVGTYTLEGCTDPSACNYLIGSTVDNGSCRFSGSACEHPDSFIVNEVIGENCECNGVWRSYEKVYGSGYDQLVVFDSYDQDYLDTLHTVSILVDGNEWGCDNYSSLVLNNGDSINSNYSQSLQCFGDDYFYGAYSVVETSCDGTQYYYESDYHHFWRLDFYTVQNSFRYSYSNLIANSSNLCPTNWHVATDNDWQNLVNYFGGNDWAGARLGLSYSGYGYWWQENNFNDLSGLGFIIDQYPSEYNSATWWSPTEDAPPGKMWIRKVVSNSPKVYRYLVDANEYHSIRCVKNP